MTQYKTQYGTVFAVKEHNGAPAIMCRAELSETWSLSSMIEPYNPGAWTAEELQAQLDSKAAIKGWQPVEEPSKTCLCETCTCTGCHEDCFGHCQGCGHPTDHCNSYQTDGEKRLRAEPASAEPPEIVDESSGPEDDEEAVPTIDDCQCRTCGRESCFAHGCDKECPDNADESCMTVFCPEYIEKGQSGAGADADGFPDWVRPMVEAFLRFPFFRELPAFTAFALRHSEPVQHHQGGSLADGLYDTSSKGIEFTIFRSDNSDKYREVSYTWADFVRRCKVEGLAPEPLHQNKEETPCNTEPTAPTGDAAATTAASAAPMQSTAAETTTTSENGVDVGSCPSAEPARQAPAALPLSAPDTAPMSHPAFDYSGLDEQTVQDLHLAEKEIREARQTYICRVSAAVALAHEAIANCDGHNQYSRETFISWCRSVGLNKDAAYRLLQVNALLTGATPEEQATLEAASPSLLYAAAKPSAPAELVQAVKDGDITSHKQYQEALAEIRARDEKITELLEMSEAADRRADKAEQAVKDTARERDDALHLSTVAQRRATEAERQRDDALRQATEAERQRDGARDALAAAKLRGDKLKAENDDLKSRPVEAQVVDEEEIDRRAKERAAELAAPLRAELEALRSRHPADLEEAEQAIRDAYDSALYTGRAIENAWHSLRPLLACMDSERRVMAVRQVEKILTQTQEELRKCL